MDMGGVLLLVGFVLFLLFLGVPVGISLGIGGIVAILLVGPNFMMLLPLTLDRSFSEFVFVAVPLFVLMGTILHRGGVGHNLFELGNQMFKRVRGGAGISAAFAFTLFASIVGSSMASVVTIGKIAVPEMRNQGYSERVTYSICVVGGGLGILIPPSIPLLLYAALTDTSPGQLFAAGVIPGLLIATSLAIWAILAAPHVRPDARFSFSATRSAMFRAIPDLLLPIIVLGGIFSGIFTPTESAAVGVIYAVVLTMILRRTIKPSEILSVALESLEASISLLAIVMGALLFGSAITLLGLPQFVAENIGGRDLSAMQLLLIFFMIWLVMGAFLEVASIILITIPIFAPIAEAAGIDLIWFGVFLVLNMELAVLTPPVGMNLFALKSLVPQQPMGSIIRATVPGPIILIIGLSILVLFPGLTSVLL